MASDRSRIAWPLRAGFLGAALLTVPPSLLAADPAVVDLGASVPKAKDLEAGLFPDVACEQLKANGFKCMGFKPPVRYALPSSAFRIGSADLPDGLKRQLDVFAEVLKTKQGAQQAVRIEGHTDASGTDEVNESLSQKRADAARDYLVGKGVAPEMLKPVGLASRDPIDSAQPLAARNRRVVIARDQPPPGQ